MHGGIKKARIRFAGEEKTIEGKKDVDDSSKRFEEF